MFEFNEFMKQKIIFILRKHDVIHAAIFGSFARNEANKQSDIDILVDLPDTKSLFDLVSIKLDLQDELGIDVDVLTYASINPKIKENVINGSIKIL